MLSFKGAHFPKDVILYAVFFYVRYAVFYRDLDEIMAKRGVNVDHATPLTYATVWTGMAKEKLTAQAWIEASFQALTKGGPQAIRAEAIARDLNVSKG